LWWRTPAARGRAGGGSYISGDGRGAELLAELAPLQAKSGDLEEERKAVRARLLHEAAADSRELLVPPFACVKQF